MPGHAAGGCRKPQRQAGLLYTSLAAEASGQKVEMGILLVHAQDHLMTSMLAIELIQELIVLHRDKADREK